MRHRPRHHFGRPQQVIHPTKHNCVHKCTESIVEHVHPSHTTVLKHHVTKNKHVFPHSTSVQQTASSVDVYGGSFNVPPRPGFGPGGQVAGVATPGMGYGPGAMAPGMGYGPGSQVAGAVTPGMGYGPGAHQWKKPGKWC
ncbi:spore coat protein [Virgibacillus sp. C22-A2]|uniref:Spore coat protein n=1 Tax=Virgibacillus tibetensis TaxID=3042313 RepID=A0ABU6KLE0_9BACI|nr:spore coat protein [Virgibacillus sp. C22-A2]